MTNLLIKVLAISGNSKSFSFFGWNPNIFVN
jgi:hypothetical protein